MTTRSNKSSPRSQLSQLKLNDESLKSRELQILWFSHVKFGSTLSLGRWSCFRKFFADWLFSTSLLSRGVYCKLALLHKIYPCFTLREDKKTKKKKTATFLAKSSRAVLTCVVHSKVYLLVMLRLVLCMCSVPFRESLQKQIHKSHSIVLVRVRLVLGFCI